MKKASIKDLQEEILALAKAKGFPLKPSDQKFLIKRILSEVEELKSEKLPEKIAEEAIDILVQSVQLVLALGLDPNEIYRQKMDKNWHRKWQRRDDGEFRSS